jgi:tetratricopeptide (TPR) repeat protein
MTASSSRLDRLLRFLEHDADNLALRKDAIREAYDTGQWPIARELLDAGLLSQPQEAEMLAFSGLAHLHAQRYHDAEQALSVALTRGLNEPELRYNLAFALFMQKRHAAALEHLIAPRVVETLPFALLLRARCQHHLDRPAEAIADCEAHLATAPEHAETHGLLALILYEQHQREQAREHVASALRQDPTQLEALLAQASLQSDAQEYDAARGSFDALLLAHPQYMACAGVGANHAR